MLEVATVLIVAQLAAAPTPAAARPQASRPPLLGTVTPAPGAESRVKEIGGGAGPSLASIARPSERKARVVISDLPSKPQPAPTRESRERAGAVPATRPAAASQDSQPSDTSTAQAAQERMRRAVENGLRADTRTCGRGSSRSNARAEWDAAAESCRKTPGCVPTYRDDVALGGKKLKTDDELIDDVAKRLTLSK